MNKNILLTSIVSVLSVITIAYADSIMTSKGYVDTQIDTTQVKIPASNPNNATLGDTVMTYTAAGNGTIGERGIYSDASSYTAATDEGKLITASALTGAFNALPTTTTTKLVCANDPACTLWTVTPQTAYGAAASGGNGGNSNSCPSESALVEMYIDSEGLSCPAQEGITGWKNLTSGSYYESVAYYNENGCAEFSEQGLQPGEWKENNVKGRAICKDLYGSEPDNSPEANTCYCQITGFEDGSTSCSITSNTLYYVTTWGDYSGQCLDVCAHSCVAQYPSADNEQNIILE